MAHTYILIMQERDLAELLLLTSLSRTQAAFPAGREGSFQLFHQTVFGIDLNIWEETAPACLKNKGCLDHDGTYRPCENLSRN